jgi:hypothetical protein
MQLSTLLVVGLLRMAPGCSVNQQWICAKVCGLPGFPSTTVVHIWLSLFVSEQ